MSAGVPLKFSMDRMVKGVQNCRKDEIVIEFARQVATGYAAMVAEVSERSGSRVQVHNNKTIFLEGLDIWFRKNLSQDNRNSGRATSSPRDVIAAAMAPWYAAMGLDDPSQYRAGSCPALPRYAGDEVDATVYMLGVCACLEIQPLEFRFGMQGDVPVHVWGRVHAGGKWYDTDVSVGSMKLGDQPEFDKIEDVEIPL